VTPCFAFSRFSGVGFNVKKLVAHAFNFSRISAKSKPERQKKEKKA